MSSDRYGKEMRMEMGDVTKMERMQMINKVLRIIVGMLLIAGSVFLILSLTDGQSTKYLGISLTLIAAGYFDSIWFQGCTGCVLFVEGISGD